MAQKNIKSYNTAWRLFSYAFRYKIRILIGLLSGILIAGSLFGSFVMMTQVFENIAPNQKNQNTLSSKVLDVINDESLTQSEKNIELTELATRDSSKDPFYKTFTKVQNFCEKFNLPFPAKYDIKTRTVDLFDGAWVIPTEEKGNITWQAFAIISLGLVFSIALKNFFTYVNRYYTRWVGTRVVADLRNEIFDRLTQQSMGFYGKQDIGDLISRCTNNTAAIESAVANVLADLVRSPFEIFACLAGIAYASYITENYMLPIILFVGVPICFVPLLLLGQKIRKVYARSFAKIAIVVSRMHEVFTGILVVKVCHMEDHEKTVFQGINRSYFKTVIRALRVELAMSPLLETVAVLATLVFLTYSFSQGVSIANLAALMAPAFLAYQPIKNLSKIIAYTQRAVAAADSYFELIDTDMTINESTKPITLKEFKHEIKFEDVSFSYGDHKILDHLSFTIPRGQVIAVVGATGSGKTTIANLIARFYDPTEGRILIDGIDLKEIKIDDLRKLVGVVNQTPILFNTTIRENIAYGSDLASQDEIIQAAKQSNAHDFITDGHHSEGYETIVGDKGSKLSGGEKQRVSIARMILRNPPILILDEATSALDTVTEKLVQDAINNAMEHRTVFAIAHRLSTIQHADCILVIENGKIIEQGTHQELLNLNGQYCKLHNTQFQVDAQS